MSSKFAPRQITAGDPSSAVSVGPIGYGLMRLTWSPVETPDQRAFKAILTSLNAGCNLLNTGDFYGNPPDRLNSNLELLARFFEKYPEWTQDGKTFISVKSGVKFLNGQMAGPDGSEEFLRSSVDKINQKLGGKKKMDLFQMARVDKTRPIEDVMNTLKKLVNESKFKYVGLSEVSAATIRRAHAVHPISAVEVEYSPWCLDIENNGVLDACRELKIPIIAYSPLGLGMLTGSIKSPDDIPEGDMRRHFARFRPENFQHNLKLVEEIKSFASKKGCTPAQLCLSWLLVQSDLVIPIPGSTRPEGVEESVSSLKVDLSENEIDQLREIIEKAEVKGVRYNEDHQVSLEG